MTLPSEPLVSIVTPSFNQGGFIGETIASVLSQDYPRIEYLIVDGGSTDGTLELLSRFGDRLNWMSELDRGQSDAINKGWRRARGEIIAWLNADDVYRPGAIRKVVHFFKEHPHVDLVYGDCEYTNERGEVIGRHTARSASAADLLRSPTTIIPQPAAFLRRCVLTTVGYLDENLHYVMDLDYWLRVAAQSEIAYLPECLAAFRYHDRSKSVSQPARMLSERLFVYQQLFKSADLPPHLRRMRWEAMSAVYTRVAKDHFRVGDMKTARRCALLGLRYSPLRFPRTLVEILVLSLTGRRGARVAKWLRTVKRTVLSHAVQA